MDVDAR
jgi:hypothetical protein